MSLDITITNADSSIASEVISTYNLDLYIDKPSNAKLIVDKRHSISNDSSLEVVYKGKIIFRGFLETPAPDKYGKIELSFADITSLFDYRIAQIYTYPKGTTIEEILSSSTPSSSDVVGLIYLANSLVPQGLFQEYLGVADQLVYKCQGYGTTKYPSITQVYEGHGVGSGLIILTKADSLVTMVAGSWFQDADYLYVWCKTESPLTNTIKFDTTQVLRTEVPGTWYGIGSATGIFVIYGGGKKSQFGVIVDIYKGTTKLTSVITFAGLINNSFYQNDDDLFVKIPIAESLTDYLITIPNYKDTGIILGDVSALGWTMDVDFVLTKTTISSNIKDLFSHINAEYEYIYSVDGTTKFNIVDQQGRGSEDQPIHVWRIEELQDFRTTYNKGALANCIVATGKGTPAIYVTRGLLGPRRIWREVIASYQNDDIVALRESVTRELVYNEDPRSYSFKTMAIFGLRSGDMVKILRNKQKQYPIYSRIQKISYSETNSMAINLGHRQKDLVDIWNLVKPEA